MKLASVDGNVFSDDFTDGDVFKREFRLTRSAGLPGLNGPLLEYASRF
ncbi:MAG: hypothetical protein KDB22_20435 [Planctomycetales bacterium]|nr:hypothetical protein [Planctomycetales bacterium]